MYLLMHRSHSINAQGVLGLGLGALQPKMSKAWEFSSFIQLDHASNGHVLMEQEVIALEVTTYDAVGSRIRYLTAWKQVAG